MSGRKFHFVQLLSSNMNLSVSVRLRKSQYGKTLEKNKNEFENKQDNAQHIKRSNITARYLPNILTLFTRTDVISSHVCLRLISSGMAGKGLENCFQRKPSISALNLGWVAILWYFFFKILYVNIVALYHQGNRVITLQGTVHMDTFNLGSRAYVTWLMTAFKAYYHLQVVLKANILCVNSRGKITFFGRHSPCFFFFVWMLYN